MNYVISGFGRAGKAMAARILASEEHKLLLVLCRSGSDKAGMDVAEALYGVPGARLGIKILPIDQAARHLPGKADVVVDFSHPAAASDTVRFCCETGADLILCTTRHSPELLSRFREDAEKSGIGILYSQNLTRGVNYLMHMAEKIRRFLPDARFEIIERHPKDKERPMATAQILADRLPQDDVPIHSLRMDGYVSTYEIIASDGDERITITHEQISRRSLANAVLSAAEFIHGKTGLYYIDEVYKAALSE